MGLWRVEEISKSTLLAAHVVFDHPKNANPDVGRAMTEKIRPLICVSLGCRMRIRLYIVYNEVDDLNIIGPMEKAESLR